MMSPLLIMLRVMAEWLRASNSSTGAVMTGVWVRMLIMSLLSLSKIFYYNCFSSPRGINWVPARVEVDIVYEKTTSAL